jgi:predicted TIM-barrel fold metal-dependent hydrolase
MDEQGIEAELMFGSLSPSVEHEMHVDVEASYANLRAYNRWLEKEWGFGADGRIFSVPLLSLLDLDMAIAELDRLLACGARVVHLKPGPVYGRSPGEPYFDPFWARINEAGIPVAFHASDSGYNELWSVHWGERARPPLQDMSPFQWYLGSGDRPIADTMAGLVLNCLFVRFPNLKVLSIENGFAWLAPMLTGIDKAAKMGRRGKALGGHLEEEPSAVLRRHLYVSPYPEEDPLELIRLIGLDRVLFGSDYPHSEGLAEPVEFADKLHGLSDPEVKRVMRDNTAALLGLTA